MNVGTMYGLSKEEIKYLVCYMNSNIYSIKAGYQKNNKNNVQKKYDKVISDNLVSLKREIAKSLYGRLELAWKIKEGITPILTAEEKT